MKLSVSLLLTVIPVSSFVHDVCVVGAGGGLGRELVYQAITERNNTVIALTTSDKIYEPFRGDTYNEITEMPEYKSSLYYLNRSIRVGACVGPVSLASPPPYLSFCK